MYFCVNLSSLQALVITLQETNKYTPCVSTTVYKLYTMMCMFSSTWGAVLRLFRIRASETLEKSLAGSIYKEEKWRNGDKKSF